MMFSKSQFFGVLLSILLVCLPSCRNSNQLRSSEICSIVKSNDSLYFLQIKSDTMTDRWKLPYPIFKFELADINDDGLKEMVVGVIKKTRFDSTFSKRLFIFKNYKGLVRPLWLGSKLGQPLVNFRCVEYSSKAIIRSIEKEKNGQYLVAEYKWRKFGLEFINYLKRDMELNEAQNVLNSN